MILSERHIRFSFRWVILLMLFSLGPSASTASAQDSIRNQVRLFDEERLDVYRGQKKYQYEDNQGREKGLLEILRDRFLDWWANNMGEEASFATKLIFWLLAIAVIGFLIVYFNKVPLSGIYQKSARNIAGIQAFDEVIESADLAGRIQSACEQGDYRLAFRYQYIAFLHALERRGLLKLARYKTNLHYRRELAKTPVSNLFTRMADTFEYTWYGEYPITRPQYDALVEDIKGILTPGSNDG